MRNNVFEKYHDDIKTYIANSYPDIPERAVLEIAAYASVRANVFVADAVHERDKEWKKQFEKFSTPKKTVRRKKEWVYGDVTNNEDHERDS